MMKFFSAELFVMAAVTFIATSAETIQLQPSQGILIPAPIAQALRFARAAYGSAPAQSYAAPAPAQSYSAPAPAPSYSAPAPPQSYSAPAQQQASIPAPPCPNNYLFSCQPALTPVPCSSPAPAQSYSAPAPAQSYSAPAPAPAQSYSAPAPAQSYSAPAAPAQSYSAPQGAYSQYIPQFAVPVVREVY